jgi:3-deoxy-D-manno-octulosonate 8-phosphate phosphatase (KDO 8-P phosphatase)
MNLAKIKAFAFDIDGVATEGTLLCMPDGDFLRLYDAKDGFAIRMACMNGYPVAVITGGSSETIRKRMTASGIKPEDVFLHCRDKMVEFRQFCERYGLQPEEVMYFGDDIPDVEVMEACGCAVCPSDAVPEAQKAADWMTDAPGGKGCLREAIEKTLKKQGKWIFNPVVYKQLF